MSFGSGSGSDFSTLWRCRLFDIIHAMPETHILLIEDDPMSRKLFGGWITKLGFEAIYAVNGVEGMANARKFAPDLILLDYHLQEVDGLEGGERLKEIKETKKNPGKFPNKEDV